MKRWVFRTVLFLLLGAIVNVAVAWAPSYVWVWFSWSFHDLLHSSYQRKPSDWPRPVPAHWPESVFVVIWTSPVEVKREYSVETTKLVDSEEGMQEIKYEYEILLYEMGWPARSLGREQWLELVCNYNLDGPDAYESRYAGHPPRSVWRQGYEIDLNGYFIPMQPLWPGFAINTLFYAAILWGLPAAPFALRHRRRIKRGLCPRCDYPIETSNTCTECGIAVTSRARK